MNEQFPKPNFLGGNVNDELDLFIDATKSDLKNVTLVDTSDFTKKTDLADLKSYVYKLHIDKFKNVINNSSNLKIKVDKLDIAKLETTPVDVSKESFAVKNDVVKKTECNELVRNVNIISTSDTSNLYQ